MKFIDKTWSQFVKLALKEAIVLVSKE